MGEQNPQNGFTTVYVSRESVSCLLETLQDQQVDLIQAFLKITASALGLGVWDFALQEWSLYFLQLLTLLKQTPGLQDQIFWGLIFSMQDLWLGCFYPSLLGENLCSCDYLSLWKSPTWSLGFDCTMNPPLLHASLWFPLYIFICRRSFLLAFRLFS